jgi:hypothetical protein
MELKAHSDMRIHNFFFTSIVPLCFREYAQQNKEKSRYEGACQERI